MDDQSFNDQELSDIMKEIEALEDDFKAEESADVTHIKVESDPVLQALSEMPEQKAIPLKPRQVEHVETKAPATMSFKVSGELNLELDFEIGGKLVSLHVAEEGLTIVMDGGMTFKVPVTQKKAS